MASKKGKDTNVAEHVVFLKGKILQMERYADRVDLLNVFLKDDCEYSHADVESIICDFMKGGK